MALTGWPDGPPLHPGRAIPARLDRLVCAISRAGGPAVDWGPLVSGRAAILGLRRQGRVSANGSCRLLRARDGWVALNMARPTDWDMVPALIGGPAGGWDALEDSVAARRADEFVSWARTLALPAAVVGERRAAEPPWTAAAVWPRADRGRPLEAMVVVDLSALWAGPLTARLLGAAGAEVVKVESVSRPDTARSTPGFYGWLHPADQQVVPLDFSSPDGRARLKRTLERADVVIEASRPRALEQLGAAPADLAGRPGRVWLSITGHGRSSPYRDRVAFGDDAAAAGGLVAWDGAGSPVFCADAIADPITGLFGALAVLHAVRDGGGVLIDLPMAGCAAAVAAAEGRGPAPAARPVAGGWAVGTTEVRQPRTPPPLP